MACFSDLDIQIQERKRVHRIRTAEFWRAYYLRWGCSGTEQYFRPRAWVAVGIEEDLSAIAEWLRQESPDGNILELGTGDR